MFVFEAQSILMLVLLLALLVLKGSALVNALLYPPAAYDAASKQTKSTWSAILGIGLALQLVSLFVALGFLTSILNLGFTIAACVYFADVRPALRQVLGRG
ncbi:DUF2516 family protein [Nocardioides zeae]|uniref:DUF2516 family protein n=1 Tax=Nocardioides imazamoxiresistens TaxID=3231893 RepID=A0ABU3PWH6_9ACTN|nr:DUF2516 family protein [Nocardioides zeae]MDT9593551.1 DUF2516 family protein [Nocardioides zeae]